MVNKKNHVFIFVILLAVFNIAQATGDHVYQKPDAFINEVFDGNPPESEKLWIKKDLKEQVKEILGHDLGVLRVRYWKKQQRTAWILEEIGKEQPITTGIVIANGAIETVKILVFRESRGWEVRYPFFTDQFRDSSLEQDKQLDKHIDGISGATLSVHAVTKLARLALLLDQQVRK